ncbi:MAG: hypothetical protein Q9224_006607 [Gallowayella concinna]
MVKILMVHGFGTNDAIFETQTASGHQSLYDVIEDEGPFEVAWGFSGGAMILASFLLHHTHFHPHSCPPFRSAIFMNSYMPWSASSSLGKDVTHLVITQQAVPCTLAETEQLYKNITHQDDTPRRNSDSLEDRRNGSLLPPMLQQQHPSPASISTFQPPHPYQIKSAYTSHRFFPEIDKVRIPIPTAHILGTQDSLLESGIRMTEMCHGKVMRVYKHAGGHEIPSRIGKNGTRDVERIRETVEKTVQRAEFG